MKLYEIDRALEEVIERGMSVDPETGEVLFDSDDLEELQGELADKMENCGLYLKNLMSDIAALKAEESNLAERRKTAERKAERMKDYIRYLLEERYSGNFETAKVRLSLRKSTRVIVDDEAAVPDKFITIKETRSVDKKAASEAMKEGLGVAGLHLEESQNVQVR